MNALTRGAIYALIALGYTMVYGIIELINFAHGDMFMVGAFTSLTFLFQVLGVSGAVPDLPLLIAMLIGTFLVTMAILALVIVLVFRPAGLLGQQLGERA